MAQPPSLLPVIPLLLAAALSAQDGPPSGTDDGDPTPVTGATVRRTEWSSADSRQLFTAIDRSRDDRLDIFEAGAGLGAVADHKARQDFERIDRNRDGYIDFEEFDTLFRRVVEYRQPLIVRTFYPLPKVQSTEVASPSLQIVQSLDRDGDMALDRGELMSLLERFGAANLIDRMAMLDLDQSATLDHEEFAPALTLMPALANLATTANPSDVPSDHDGNGVVDASELTRSLRLLDPALARWAPRVLERADRNKDHQLGPDELGLTATAKGN